MSQLPCSDCSARHPSAIRLEQHDGVWWLVDTQGRRFVSIGVNHVQPDCWLAPYNRQASVDRYGADLADGSRFNPEGAGIRRLVDAVLRQMQLWHFNTLGIHTDGIPSCLYRDRVYYAVCIDAVKLGSFFKFGRDVFPDLFSAAFERKLDEQIACSCREHAGSANLIGYALTDIPRWYFFAGELAARPDRLPIHPWVDDLRRLPADSAGKQQWIQVLQSHYPDAVSCARVYGNSFDNWSGAMTLTDWPAPSYFEPALADSTAMIQRMVRQWYALHRRLIRRYDSHHLILGDKLHSPDRLPAWMMPILREYVDLLFIQWYQPFDVQQPVLERLYEQLGKPILNGDSSFGFIKRPQQSWVKGYKVESQEAVGRYYEDYMHGIMSLPFMVGWHHCGWVEQWDGGKSADAGHGNENGLMDPFEKPWRQIIGPVISANSQAPARHRASALLA